ncbi:MAG: hypothetical protein J5707_04475 [Candidatus Methanomethylophilus sp.]|nr:hypothetical protein [Methanomethylophilus sp.]
MNNICLRCGYTWLARAKKPLRCPNCKTTRWDREIVKDVCKRCGAEWVQRGGEIPKYCPVCHSSMWNSEKRTYTCPKCGKTRSLRSNSRENLCPECDMYSANRPAPRFTESSDRASGIGKVITLWSDGKGLTLRYVDNGTHIASLYDLGKYLGEVNIDLFCRKYHLTFELGPRLQSEEYQEVMRSAADKILFTNEVVANRTDKVRTLRGLDPVSAEIVNLYESGMSPVSIALKTGTSFSEVMDLISEIPPMRLDDDDTDKHRPRNSEKNWYLTGEFERA